MTAYGQRYKKISQNGETEIRGDPPGVPPILIAKISIFRPKFIFLRLKFVFSTKIYIFATKICIFDQNYDLLPKVHVFD
mgnify:CR=1 FL=1